VKLKNLILAIKDQGPFKRAFRNFCITGNAWGLFHINSHQRADTGKEKVGYNTKETALKSAEAMGRKNNVHFSTYRCAFCGKYHIGKNRENKPKIDLKIVTKEELDNNRPKSLKHLI
jgi:hypothetical protein